MHFSIGVEYAFHSLFFLIGIPDHKTIGIKQIAEINRISETYLSKVFAKLAKAGIVRSTPGVRGGYELAKPPEDISFWDVIEAIEGSSYFFQCAEIRQKSIFQDPPCEADAPAAAEKCPCLIKVVIQEAEELFRQSLRSKSLQWLHDQAMHSFSEGKKASVREWLNSV